MFKGDDKYGEWDGEGLPTKLKDGSDVPKSQLKKLQKQWQSQKKAHEEYLVKFGDWTLAKPGGTRDGARSRHGQGRRSSVLGIYARHLC
ncbi:hypothetical protein CH063_10838 [Colletotrichum higginsianum]|uniref:Uncharacterized protein n=1 Tax=Colletotrichum higginsianum (strain IMI 349063) TaxID=759273 RepID=H1VJ01_COLHI|nr:hypothetical protein CH063_10838 [Colletotrichum higginsianum]